MWMYGVRTFMGGGMRGEREQCTAGKGIKLQHTLDLKTSPAR